MTKAHTVLGGRPSQKTCFVIMPFTVKEPERSRYPDANHWNEVFEGLIAPAVASVGMECERDKEDFGSRIISDHIFRKIEQADLVLCDLSSQNPNVFLELGWALRGDKKFVLIMDKLTTYTFDLSQQYTYSYSHQLQPSVLRREMRELADVVKRTLNDEDRRYSVVDRLAITFSAVKALESNDLQAKLLADIQQRLSSIEQPHAAPNTSRFPWPTLLRKSSRILTAATARLANTPQPLQPALVRRDMTAIAKESGAFQNRQLQFSVVSEVDRAFLYHDWDDMVGTRARHIGDEGADIFDEVFAARFGAVAWTDRASNLPYDLSSARIRLNIALFAEVERLGCRVVVEAHDEI